MATGNAAAGASVWRVGGQPTEVLQLPASSRQPEVQVLVIAGNPGAAPFYQPFLASLHARLGGRASVAAVSQLGMDTLGLVPAGRVFSLEQQIEHKVALLREHFAGAGRPPLVVIGHSIGAYISIHAVHRLECRHPGSSHAVVEAVDRRAAGGWGDATRQPTAAAGLGAGEPEVDGLQAQLAAELQRQAPRPDGRDGPAEQGGGQPSNVSKVIGLFPFLQVDPDCGRQRRLASLTRHHTLVGRLAGGLGRLPLGLRRGLVRLLARGMDGHAVDTVAQVFTSAACVENGLYLGRTEFEALAAPADWWLLRQLGRRFAVFAAPNDTWFKAWKWEALHREVPGVESHWAESQTHAFCVSAKQSEELAALVVPVVDAALPELAALVVPVVDAALPAAETASKL